MVEDKQRNRSVVSARRGEGGDVPNNPRDQIGQEYRGSLTVYGGFYSIAQKFRLKRLQALIEQEREVVQAHSDLMRAERSWREAVALLEESTLEDLKAIARIRVQAEKAEEDRRLAKARLEAKQAQLQIDLFEETAKAAEFNAKADTEDAQARYELARQRHLQAKGLEDKTPAQAEPPTAAGIEDELLQLVQEMSVLEQQRNEALNADPVRESEVLMIEQRISVCLRRKERLEEQLAGV